MKVLVLGASGFIGFRVAQALVRSGHIVYGLTRSKQSARELEAEEISPILGQPTDRPFPFEHLISVLDAIVDCSGGPAEQVQISAIETFRQVKKLISRSRRIQQPKLTYLWTSGLWVHNDEPYKIKTEGDPLEESTAFSAWRIPIEDEIRAEEIMNGAIMRAAILYGRSGSLFADYFEQAHKSQGRDIVLKANHTGVIWSTIHQDDLADIFVRAVERGHLIQGQVFDVTAYNESAHSILSRLAYIASDGAYDKVKYEKAETDFDKAASASVLLRPVLAKSLLDWPGPKKASMLEGIEVYYRAYLASLHS